MSMINWSYFLNEKSNGVDPDQMLQNALSDEGLHCFPYM